MAIDPGRVKALFQEAIEREDPAERRAFLDREAGDDAALRDRLDALLAEHDRPPGALDRPLAPDLQATANLHGATGDFAPAAPVRTDGDESTRSHRGGEGSPPLGTVIAGRYKLRQGIGEGGMGSVYLAEQLQPVKRQVALKFIKPGMDSRTVLTRFESERQALALMDHPHIAKVLDAGTTEAGRPFFIMELVKGIPLTDYCDRHQLDLPTRLAIFRQICSAVQHAHQKGIIHRDLKPTNILVESHDGKPVPKVIDFGLAKATSGMQLSEHSLFTAFGSVTGTPLYMAPEQATFNALDVNTRADIYALGVILYELLTGSTPIQRGTMRQAALDEMLRVIREVEPPKPSSRISTSEGLPSLAANRDVEPSRLSRLVRGDLDWIVMKALAKERDRRYDSATSLSDDVERFLLHEPVTAGPPTAAYRMRKFVRRNRGQVAAAAMVLLALIVGVVGTTLGLFEARRQQQLAMSQKAIAIEAASQEQMARQSEATQRKDAERRLTQVEKANEILGSIIRDLNPWVPEKSGMSLADMLYRSTSRIEDEATGDPLTVARIQLMLGESLIGLGSPTKAIELLTKCRDTFASRLGPDNLETLSSTCILAEAYQGNGQADRAMTLLVNILAIMKARFGLDSIQTIDCMNQLAEVYWFSGQLEPALTLFEETLALKRAKLGPHASGTLITMNNLAGVYRDTGRLDQAIPLFEQTLALRRAKHSPDHPFTLLSMSDLALTYRAAGQLDRAIPLAEEALRRGREAFTSDHFKIMSLLTNLAHCHYLADQPDREIPLWRELVERKGRVESSDSPILAWARRMLGQALVRKGQWAEGELVLRQVLPIIEVNEPDAWWTFETRSLLGEALYAQKRSAEAEPLLRSGYEGMKPRSDKIPPLEKINLVKALDRLIAFGEATGKADEVEAWKAERAKLTAEAPKSR